MAASVSLGTERDIYGSNQTLQPRDAKAIGSDALVLAGSASNHTYLWVAKPSDGTYSSSKADLGLTSNQVSIAVYDVSGTDKKFAIFYKKNASNTDIYCKTGYCNGTDSKTVTINATEYSLGSLTNPWSLDAIALDSTHIAVAYTSNGVLYSVICAIDGSDAITFGTSSSAIKTIDGGNDSYQQVRIAAIDSSHWAILFRQTTAGADQYKNFIVIEYTSDGAAVTNGTPVSWGVDVKKDPSALGNWRLCARSLTSTSLVLAYLQGSYGAPNTGKAYVASLSGTNNQTVSVGTASAAYASTSADQASMELVVLDSSTFAIAWGDHDYPKMWTAIGTVSGTDITWAVTATEVDKDDWNEPIDLAYLSSTTYAIIYLGASRQRLKLATYTAAVAGGTYSASGSATLSGTAAKSKVIERTASGAIVCSGAAAYELVESPEYEYSGSGTLLSSGTALYEYSVLYVVSMSGTLLSSGTASYIYTVIHPYSAAGSITYSGVALASLSIERVASGTLLTSGSASVEYSYIFEYSASGSLLSSGTASYLYSAIFIYIASGFATLSGNAVPIAAKYWAYGFYISTTGDAENPASTIIDTNKIVTIARRSDATPAYAYARVGTITEAGKAVSWGSAYSATSGKNVDSIWIDKVSTTRVLICYKDQDSSNVARVRYANISGDTISFSSEFTFSSSAIDRCRISVLNSSEFIVVYTLISDNRIYCQLGTISGVSITFGAPYAIDSTTATHSPLFDVKKISSTRFVVTYCLETTYTDKTYARVGLNSSGTITFGAQVEVQSKNSTYSLGAIPSVCVPDSTHLLFATVPHKSGRAGDRDVYVRCGSLSGETITLGTELSITATSAMWPIVVANNENEVSIFYYDSSSALSKKISIVGTTLYESGSYTFGTSFYQIFKGDLVSDNVYLLSVNSYETISKVVLYNASWTTFRYTASGSATLGGDSADTYSKIYLKVAGGGCTISGAAECNVNVRECIASGSATLSGIAECGRTEITYEGSGSSTLSGTSAKTIVIERSTSGGMTFASTSAFTVVLVFGTAGDIHLSGSAAYSKVLTTTISAGTAYEIVANTAKYNSVSKLSTTTFVAAYKSGADNTGYVVIGTISAGAISYGTPVQISTDTTIRSLKVEAISSSAFVVLYLRNGAGSNGYIEARYCTVSGSTITLGSENNVSSSYNGAISTVAFAYQKYETSDSAAVFGCVYAADTAGQTKLVSQVFGVKTDGTIRRTGDTVMYTLNTSTGGTQSDHQLQISKSCTDGYTAIWRPITGTYAQKIMAGQFYCAVSGSTYPSITWDDTKFQCVSSTTIANVSSSPEWAITSIIRLDASNLVVSYSTGSGYPAYGRSRKLTLSGSPANLTITLDTEYALTSDGKECRSYFTLDRSATKFISAWHHYTTASPYYRMRVVQDSVGATITAGGYNLDVNAGTSETKNITGYLISDTQFLLMYDYNNKGYCQIFTITDYLEYLYTGTGTRVLSGTAPKTIVRNYTGSGSMTLSGEVVHAGVHFIIGSGSLVSSGAASYQEEDNYYYTGSGRIYLTGAASYTEDNIYEYSASGSGVLSGAAISCYTNIFEVVAEGTALTSGEATDVVFFANAGICIAEGGAVLSQEGTYVWETAYYPNYSASGSATLGGSGQYQLYGFYIAGGDVHFAGSATTSQSRLFSYDGTGLITISGTSQKVLILSSAGSGTITISGSSQTGFILSKAGTGTIHLSGEALCVGMHVGTATGSLILYGHITGTLHFAYSASGSATLGGSAAKTIVYARSGSGSLITSGAASYIESDVYPYTGSGTLRLSGQITGSTYYAYAASGTATFSGAGDPHSGVHIGPASGTATFSGAGICQTSYTKQIYTIESYVNRIYTLEGYISMIFTFEDVRL